MKTSELIGQLQEELDKHGDAEVVIKPLTKWLCWRDGIETSNNAKEMEAERATQAAVRWAEAAWNLGMRFDRSDCGASASVRVRGPLPNNLERVIEVERQGIWQFSTIRIQEEEEGK